MEWLCIKSPSLPLTVESRTIVDFVEDGLTSHFFTPMLQDLAECRKLGAVQAVSTANHRYLCRLSALLFKVCIVNIRNMSD